MKEILIGLISLVLSGLTYVAYKHSTGYRKIYSILMPISGAVSLCFLFGNLIMMYFSVRLLGMILSLNASQKLGDAIISSHIKSLNKDFDFILWTVSIGVAVVGYLFFLYKLPVILQIKDKKI